MTPRIRRFGASLAAAGVLALAAGCSSGSRSSPVTATTAAPGTALGGAAGTPSGNAAVDAVLQKLEMSRRPPFTATYGITRKLGPLSTAATVVHDGTATAITVGDVRFLPGDDPVTCSLSQQTCEPGLRDARISDYSVASGFYAAAPARALRVAYSRSSADPAGSTQTVGGAAATCVVVPIGGGSETYCATDQGVVARWDTAAIEVELEAIQASADPAAFAAPGR